MIRLIYILSASHSGSTLLAMLLGAHPEVTTVGELKATNLGDVDRYRCSCGAFVRQCPFWQSVIYEMVWRGEVFDLTRAGTDFRESGSRWADFLLKPLVRGPFQETLRDLALNLSPSWWKRYPDIRKRNLTLVEIISDLTGSEIIVDSSKIGIRLKYLLRIPEFEVKVIRLIRDGRAVATTYTNPAEYADARQPELRGGGMGGGREREKLSIAQAAREWRRSNEEAEAILAGLDRTRWRETRYESLCRDPETSLRELFAFIGVKPINTAECFRDRELHVLGNGMRLDATSEIRIDERWKTILTPHELNVFEAEAGDLNRRYGYQSI
jgi:hypothetical protein